MKQTERHK